MVNFAADELSGLPKKISCEEKRRLKEEQEKSAKLEEIKEEPEQSKEEAAPPPDQPPPQVEKAPSEKAEAAPEIEEVLTPHPFTPILLISVLGTPLPHSRFSTLPCNHLINTL